MLPDPASPTLGQLGISEPLRQFVAQMSFERRPILDFLMEVAADTAAGATVLDVGAGDAPYRELFAHVRYLTNDWEESLHPGARRADLIAPAWDIPLESESVDLVVCTQVLEHVATPGEVLNECLRLLKPTARLALTVPLVWQLHELPHDYYRYTSPGLNHLLTSAGFVDVDIRARNDCFSTLAQLMMNVGSTMGRAADGLDERRNEVQQILTQLAGEVASFGPLDVERTLPLGYSATARRP
jgi:SAM-dependent methyltransferase